MQFRIYLNGDTNDTIRAIDETHHNLYELLHALVQMKVNFISISVEANIEQLPPQRPPNAATYSPPGAD